MTTPTAFRQRLIQCLVRTWIWLNTPDPPAPPRPPTGVKTMGRTFKSFDDDTIAKTAVEAEKTAAAIAADQAALDAKVATSGAKGAQLNALTKIGGSAVLPSTNGFRVFSLDRTKPDGFSVLVVPDGSTIEVPDDAPADPPAGTAAPADPGVPAADPASS